MWMQSGYFSLQADLPTSEIPVHSLSCTVWKWVKMIKMLSFISKDSFYFIQLPPKLTGSGKNKLNIRIGDSRNCLTEPFYFMDYFLSSSY